MQEFTTAQPHPFSINGRKFYLPGIRAQDFEAASEFADMSPDERFVPFREFLAGRVRPVDAPWWFGRLRGHRAVVQLNHVQLVQLWHGWVGLPGEASSSSRTSSESTGTSSPTTSGPSTQSPSGTSEDTSSQS